MIDIIGFKTTVEAFYKQLLEVDSEIGRVRLSADKWSLKELLGHLIDSASNNHQRFVRLQFDDLLDFPAYVAEDWVNKQSYNTMDWNVLVALWYHYNLLLINIIENMNIETYGNVWVKDEDTIKLDELIEDYYKHLAYHIGHFTNRVKELAGRS